MYRFFLIGVCIMIGGKGSAILARSSDTRNVFKKRMMEEYTGLFFCFLSGPESSIDVMEVAIMSLQPERERGAHSTEEVAVRALYQCLLETWNQRNAEAMAALFVADGTIIGFDGTQNVGQAEIAATTRQIFIEHLTHTYVGKVREVRFLRPDVALLRAVVGFIAPGQTDLDAALNAVQTLVSVRRNGKWLVELFQNTPAQFHGRPDLAQQLLDELRELLK